MWLFVFIVATFFYLYITIGFACLTPKGRVAGERGMFGLGIKNTTDRELNPKSWTKQSLKNVRQSKKKVCQA